ncbi:NAD(P)-binding protein [Daedaleopsis nitida]|nr:NAD(P)-binding protein [Daedaleopsis nitida]
MAPVNNGRVVFNEIPTGYPVPGKTTIYDESQSIDLENEPLHGGILVKVLILSIDPYLRHLMHPADPSSPLPMFEVGKPMAALGVGVVLRSENPEIAPGSHVTTFLPVQHYAVIQSARVLENKEKLPWSVYVGVCGGPGQTSHHAWLEYSHAKKGDIAFVTTAAGPVGATVVQIAKAQGLKVIASAGSDEKVEFVRSIGADVAFNYKTTSTKEVLKKEGPINVYWDNVGGEALEAALEYAAHKSHFIICGMISNYNTPEAYNVKNLENILWREITLHGFLTGSLMPKYAEEFFRTFPARVASGEVKYLEHRVNGLENFGQAVLDVQSGKNFGKMVVIVAEE